MQIEAQQHSDTLDSVDASETTTRAVKTLPAPQPQQQPARKALRQKIGHELRDAAWALHFKLCFANLICALLPATSLNSVRAYVYRRIGMRIAPHVSFGSRITVIGGPGVYGRLSVGEGSLIGVFPIFNLDDTITIGQNVALGPSVSIYTSTHLIGPASRRMNPHNVKRPVVIEDGAWVGVGSIILPGVVIGRGSVVGAGSVVTEHVAPNTLVAGNPAKLVQELPWADR